MPQRLTGKQAQAKPRVAPTKALPAEESARPADWLESLQKLGAEGKKLGEELEQIVAARRS